MQLIQARISQTQVIPLSEHWQKFIMFVQAHPYCTIEKLKFENGEPRIAEVDLKATEVFKF